MLILKKILKLKHMKIFKKKALLFLSKNIISMLKKQFIIEFTILYRKNIISL